MVGFEVLTADDGAMDARDMVVVKYDGAIVSPMASNLRAIWEAHFEKFVLKLNVPGGVDLDGMAVISVLKKIRERDSLIALVAEHDLCASMCIALCLQGQKRYASPVSSGCSTVRPDGWAALRT